MLQYVEQSKIGRTERINLSKQERSKQSNESYSELNRMKFFNEVPLTALIILKILWGRLQRLSNLTQENTHSHMALGSFVSLRF